MMDTGVGKETVIAELLSFLSEKIEMKVRARNQVWQLRVFENCESARREEIDEHPEQETFAISIEKVGDERLQEEVFLQNWTRRASMVTVRNWVKNKCQGSDLQYSLCCISATKERTSKAQFDCCVRS